MMQVLAILFLTILQFFVGFGLLRLMRIKLKPGLQVPLSILMGIAIFSFLPFLLQLFYIPLNKASVFASILLVAIILNIGSLPSLNELMKTKTDKPMFKLYEIPFFLFISFLVMVSVWRCFYYPPTPRDLTSGAELIAEYAIREGSMINSIFSVDLSTTNNQFKPPFITSLQVIYKLSGLQFGQLWLSAIFISFLVFLYHAMIQKIHRLIACFLLLAFVAIPEMYAYTFMALFDYSNAVFFFLSVFFLVKYFETKSNNLLLLSAVLMGIATYIRSETLLLACFLAPALAVNRFRESKQVKQVFLSSLLFLLPSLLLYILSVSVYIKLYLPQYYHVEGLLNQELLNLQPFAMRFRQITAKLLLGSDGISMYSYFFFIFLVILFIDTVANRYWNRAAMNFLYSVLVIYVGLAFLGYLLPLMDLDNSTKRGMFKIFPLMLLYMANSRLLIGLSESIWEWEGQDFREYRRAAKKEVTQRDLANSNHHKSSQS